MDYSQPVSKQRMQTAADALIANGMIAIIVNNGQEAKDKVLELVPKGSEVFTMSSITLETIGLPAEINDSGRYQSVRTRLNAMDRKTQVLDMNKLGAGPEYAIGSVHALTEDGKVIVASNTGSQLAAYASGAAHVIWVVGAQKIVKDLDDGMKRIFDYVTPLESIRARKAYHLPDTWNSYPSKMLIVNREVAPQRITVILVREALGF